MKHRNKKLLMSGLLALTLGLGVSGTAFAYQDDFSKKSPHYNSQFESQMIEVMTTKNYGAWKELVEDSVGQADEVITKDNFHKFTEAWRLANEGNIREANMIRKELELQSNNESNQMRMMNNR